MITVMGLTMVIATGGTDISVGSIAAITGVFTASLIGGDFVDEIKKVLRSFDCTGNRKIAVRKAGGTVNGICT